MKKLLLIKLLFWITQAGISPQTIDKNRIEYLCERQYFLDNVYSMEFSVENLRRALEYSGIKSPLIAFQQAVLETVTSQVSYLLRAKICSEYAPQSTGRRQMPEVMITMPVITIGGIQFRITSYYRNIMRAKDIILMTIILFL